MNTEEVRPENQQANKELFELFAQKYKNQPKSSVEIVNIKGKGYYADLSGNRITIPSRSQISTEAWACRPADESGADFLFVSMERQFTCGFGYRFIVTYTITSEFNLLSWTAGTPSTGRVQLRNGTTVIHTTPSAKINVQPTGNVVGTNGYGKDLNEYIVTFTTDYVPEGTYNNATNIRSNATTYTDCTDYPLFIIPYAVQLSVVGSQHTTQPCLRIDKVYWNTSSGLGASLAGADVTGSSCSFPHGYVFPDKQEVQIKINGIWEEINLWKWNPAGSPAKLFLNNGLINYWDVWYIDMEKYGPNSDITISAGTYQVRYRNKQINGTGGPCESSPANTWVTENWYLSI